MLGWLTRSKKEEAKADKRAPAKSGEQFQRRTRYDVYDPELVKTLESDHKELLALYGHIGQLYEKGMYSEIVKHLVVFKTRLEGHLLTENFRFYSYLEERLAGDPNDAAIMRDFRREMNTISRNVLNFIRSYQTKGINDQNARQFWQDYSRIGEVLQERIMREEHNLYPIYVP